MVRYKEKSDFHLSIKTSVSGDAPDKGPRVRLSSNLAFLRENIYNLAYMMKSGVVPGFGVLSEEKMGFTAPLGEGTWRATLGRGQFTLTTKNPHTGGSLH